MLDRFDKHLLALVGIALTGLIFMIDAVSPIGVLVPTLYLLLIPIVAAFDIAGAALWYLLAVTALSIVGAALSPDASPTPGWAIAEVVVNRVMMAVASACACYAVVREATLRRALGHRDDADLLTGLPAPERFVARADALRASHPGALALVAFRVANRPALVASGPAIADGALVALANGCRTGLYALALGAQPPGAVLAVLRDDPDDPAEAVAGRLCRAIEARPLLGPDGAALPLVLSCRVTPLAGAEPVALLARRVLAARENAGPAPAPAA